MVGPNDSIPPDLDDVLAAVRSRRHELGLPLSQWDLDDEDDADDDGLTVSPVYSPDLEFGEDPTAFNIDFDPRTYRMRGVAVHGNTPFDVPFISEILPGFYQGGCEQGLVLPKHIEYVVSLYRWERYTLHDGVQEFKEVTMYDSNEGPDTENILELARLVNSFRARGNTLVHCQAGLNRSGLVAATALMLEGRTAKEAIDLLRASRSPAVLCNPAFEEWLLRLEL